MIIHNRTDYTQTCQLKVKIIATTEITNAYDDLLKHMNAQFKNYRIRRLPLIVAENSLFFFHLKCVCHRSNNRNTRSSKIDSDGVQLYRCLNLEKILR